VNLETRTDLPTPTLSSESAASTSKCNRHMYWLRAPERSDAADIHRLISRCPPLDLNSVYTYLLLSEHFRQTCIVAGSEDRLLGFVSAYLHPQRADALFVWQVAVDAQARGRRLAQHMLTRLLQREALADVKYIETTVGPGNRASRRVFERLAVDLSAPMGESPLFEASLFGGQSHEDEPLLRIGPFQSQDQPGLAAVR
jgi:L-2,4-diaminobutyric acid acetyltransferase